MLLNTIFATTQLLLALGIAFRPTARLALGASIAWAIGVWWFGEGLGGVLTGNASPVSGAPGAVVIYALLAVLLWPADRDGEPAPCTAARAIGARPARALWLVLWLSLAYFALLPASRAPQALSGMLSSLESGEPGWLAAIDRGAAVLVAGQGLAASIVLAMALTLIAVGVYLPRPAARATLVLAILVATAIWVFGEAFGAILTGSATDPNSGPLLALLALAYWPVTTMTAVRAPTAPRRGRQLGTASAHPLVPIASRPDQSGPIIPNEIVAPPHRRRARPRAGAIHHRRTAPEVGPRRVCRPRQLSPAAPDAVQPFWLRVFFLGRLA